MQFETKMTKTKTRQSGGEREKEEPQCVIYKELATLSRHACSCSLSLSVGSLPPLYTTKFSVAKE